jgi:rare lipoprotein A
MNAIAEVLGNFGCLMIRIAEHINSKRGIGMQYRPTSIVWLTISILSVLCPATQAARAESGIASVYSGEKTANGEYAYSSRLTAAHKSLPFNTMVQVTNRSNGRSVIVRINDRGPFVRGRIIDLTPAGARAIGSSGLARVDLQVLGRTAHRSSRPDNG